MTNNHGTDWDLICSFEVAEHVSRSRVPKFLDNILKHCNERTLVLLSTPCFSEKIGAADNHTYDGQDGFGIRRQELTREELKELIEPRFNIEENYGTFASQKDYKPHMTDSELDMFNRLSKYYDTNLLSVIFAPLFPAQSRNNIWICKIK